MNAPVSTKKAIGRQNASNTNLAHSGKSGVIFRPKLIRMDTVEPRRVPWLWENRIPLGRLSLLVGMPGAGKSFLTCEMATHVSNGTPWCDGSPCDKGSVILISAEDDPNDTIRPRLDAHGADASRVHLLPAVRGIERDGKESELLFSLADGDVLEMALKEVGDCRLIVIDPIGSFLGGGVDAYRDNEVRGVLAPIALLAENFGLAVVMVAHRRKSVSSFADDLVLGSRAFTGIARCVWHLGRDREDKSRRLLLPGKSNVAAEQSGLAFTISGKPPALQWEAEPVILTADELLAMEVGGRKRQSALAEAVDWLKSFLGSGPKLANEVHASATEAGIKRRTLERAKKELKINNGPDGFGGAWVWRLPASASDPQDSPECASSSNLVNSGDSADPNYYFDEASELAANADGADPWGLDGDGGKYDCPGNPRSSERPGRPSRGAR